MLTHCRRSFFLGKSKFRCHVINRAISKSACVACLTLALASGCSADRGLHLTIHPAFPPIVPIQDREEIQVTWVRSWRPTIYLRAEFDSDDFDRDKRVRLSYSISNEFISKPRTISITEHEWHQITESLNSLGFWDSGWECEEIAYREQSLYIGEMNECEEIVMTDGATMSIAATNGRTSKGVRAICPDLGMCEPLGNVPKTMLEIAGLDSEL